MPLLPPRLRWAATFLLLPCSIVLPAAAQVALPRVTLSVPTDQPLLASLQSVAPCQRNGDPIVLPPVSLGSAPDTNLFLREQAQTLENAPKNSNLWLHIVASGDALTGNETEKQLTDRVDSLLGSMPLASPAVHGLIVEARDPRTAPDLYAFELLRLALIAKSSQPALKLALVFPAGFIGSHADLVKRLANFADVLGMPYGSDWKKDAAWIADQALNKPLILQLASDAQLPLAAQLAVSGTSVEFLWSQPANVESARTICNFNSFMKRAIPIDPFRLNVASAPFHLSVDGKEEPQPWLFGSERTSDVAIVARVDSSPDHPKSVSILGDSTLPYVVKWFDPATGAQVLASASADAAGNPTQTLTSTSEYLVISFHKQGEADSTVYNSVDVTTGADLTVEQIVARWQQYREAQRRKLDNYISSSFMNLHFESTNVISAFDVSMQIKRFYNRSGQMELAQTALYVNGVKFNNKYEFPLPQLEPEKVLTPPFELKLNERYTYKLLGREKIDGTLCYAVDVQPRAGAADLYSGKIWIDVATFREVKQTLSQRGDNSNIVANVETQNYDLVPDGKGNRFNLLSSISEQQTLNAAGRDFLLQRSIQFSGYEINVPQFDSLLAAEHRSLDPMYRDTDHGLRTLKKQGDERILVESTQKRISSIVAGAMYEGTFNFPIPIAGLTIADFDYRHTGAQLSTFYAGVLLATDLSKQFGSKYRLSGDLALSAIPGEERLYSGNAESTGAQAYAWAEDIGARATWLATKHLSLTATGYLEYDFFHATSDTSNAYVLPRNGVALIPGAQVRFTDKGYIFTADGSRGQRLGWRQFGCTAPSLQADGCSPAHTLQSGYTLYDGDLNKDYYFTKFTKGGWDASYYGGNQLDRFSRYFPSIFSQPNIHGIPAGTDSFDAIAMVNAHYGFNVMDFVKLDLMYNYARARNEEESSHFRKFDGLESHIDTPGPFGTLIQSTVSYAIDGNLDRYNSRWGVLFLILKPLH
jgi:hypothetical protein